MEKKRFEYTKVSEGMKEAMKNFYPKVWYKGEVYFLIENKNGVAKLQDVTHDKETRSVESKFIMTDEEHELKVANTRSTHVTW